jgi:hypothetical protein
MAEVLGMMYMHGRGLLWGRWWLVDPKLVFDHMFEIKNTHWMFEHLWISFPHWTELWVCLYTWRPFSAAVIRK